MSRFKDRIAIIFLALLVAAGSAIVYSVEPTEASWLPKCPFHAITGLECPSCGSTRALHYILHGELYRGLSFNPMAPLLWLLAGTVVVVSLCLPRLRTSALMRALVGAYIGLYLLWWVVRNI